MYARQGKNGRASASGYVKVSGQGIESYRFALSLRNFNALETGVYAASFDGDFTITDGPRVGGQLLPFVEGNVRLERAAILFDFANQSEVQKLAVSTTPLFCRITSYNVCYTKLLRTSDRGRGRPGNSHRYHRARNSRRDFLPGIAGDSPRRSRKSRAP